ncbi:MAG: NAD(P)-dependent oxidoreductase [Chloroflexi bacterium]|nr:NAD(P)-dependent oxidoreductase [Chloroflexota bacterium]
MKTVGFIGLGVMGRPMATNVRRKGFPLVVYDLRPEPVAELVAQGAQAAGSPREVAQRSDVVVIMVRTSADVEQVIAGADGVLDGLKSSQTVIDMSTIAPSVTRRLAERVHAAGGRMLDAPVTRGQPGAIAGTLAVMVGGDPAVLEAHRDVLRAMATDIIHCGPNGIGQVVKLTNNLIAGVVNQAVSEGLVMGVKAGARLDTLLNLLHNGSARNYLLDEFYPRKALRGDFTPGFTVDLMAKDLDLALELGREINVPLIATAICRQLLGQAQAQGRGGLDQSGVLAVLEEMAGIEVRLPEVASAEGGARPAAPPQPA